MKKFVLTLLIVALALSCTLMFTACDDKENEAEKLNLMSAEEIERQFSNAKAVIRVSGTSTEDGETTGTGAATITFAENDTAVFYAVDSVSSDSEDTDDLDSYKVLSIKSSNEMFMVYDTYKVSLGAQGGAAYQASMSSVFTTYLASYASVDDSLFTKGGTATIAGRTCTKYSYNPMALGGLGALGGALGGLGAQASAALAGASLTYDYYIDNATGFCMKMDIAGESEGEGGSMSWEVTSLQIGNVDLSAYINLPTQTPPEDDYDDYE